MESPPNAGAIHDLDPRVRRSRQMLRDALAKLLKEKDFEEISVGDIAQQSTLNRATFYDHYSGKRALLECLVGSQFQDLLAKRNIRFDGCHGALKKIAMGVCYYLAETAKPGASSAAETAIVAVVRRTLLEGFAQHPPRTDIPVEMLASTLAWAIYGAAQEWAQARKRVPVAKIGGTIEKLVTPILTAGR